MFCPVYTFPASVLTASGSEGMISARKKSKLQNIKIQGVFDFVFCFLGFIIAPHCVKYQCKINEIHFQ